MVTAYVPTLHEILKKTQAISPASLKRAQELQKVNGKKLIRVLIDEGVIAEKDLMFLLSSELGVPVLDLTAYKIDSKVLEIIPKKIAERYEVIPISKIGNWCRLPPRCWMRVSTTKWADNSSAFCTPNRRASR